MRTLFVRCATIFISLCIIAIALIGCANSAESLEEEIIDSEHLMSYISFEDLVNLSDSAILGKYVETITYDNYVEHRFIVDYVYYGNVTDQEIYLYSNIGTAHVSETNYEYDLGSNPYEVGKEYILIMDKYESIMFSHDRYVTGAELIICPEDNLFSMYSQPIMAGESEGFIDYFVSLPNSYVPMTENITEFNNATEQSVSEAEYVAKVRIDDLYFEGEIHNGNTYLCEVELLYKGNTLNLRGDGKILLVILKDTVDVGNEYIICFSQVGPNSIIYQQQTTDSVFEVTKDIEAIIKTYTK